MTPNPLPSNAGTPALPDAPPGLFALNRALRDYWQWWELQRRKAPGDLVGKLTVGGWKAQKTALRRALRELLRQGAAALQQTTVGGATEGAVPEAPAAGLPAPPVL